VEHGTRTARESEGGMREHEHEAFEAGWRLYCAIRWLNGLAMVLGWAVVLWVLFWWAVH
jgi:hypothetical protein